MHEVVAFNAGPAGETYLVLACEPLDYATQSDGFAVFPKVVPDAPQRYRVIVLRSGEVERDLPIEGERFNVHEVQPLGGDELLLICARSRFRSPQDFDLNGRVYSSDGRFLRGMLLGDGVQSAQATQLSELWAAYFDEGVLGNFGWTRPVGAAGLVAFSGLGEMLYEYAPPAGLDAITDCYALNVATDDDVWCCYYTGFPIVHLHQRRIANWWLSPVQGATAFAIGNDQRHALFAGSYKSRQSLFLVHLGPQGQARTIGEFELRDGDGSLPPVQRVVGRGSSLYLLGDGMLHHVTVEGALAAGRR